MKVESAAEIYQRKRTKFLPVLKACIVVFMCVVVFFFVTEKESVWMFVLASISTAIGIIIQMTLNTCPKCGAAQFKYLKFNGKLVRSQRWDLNPIECPLCGEKLK
ncbi:hypothetical protein PRUB_a1068 [Pseudoalteromonas rubra]|uniref:Uncharacterized protein n=1 Tax=Pseudoalteromonas rubra TaxID=43658 RepID=A0A8T0C6Y1_9GAMM|nr:hypothetical protein [Pseudoalteromonas rubra]KAF7786486.1 hypothetical protein PRUB_a1068 [Pseudoalteromonas rubra]